MARYFLIGVALVNISACLDLTDNSKSNTEQILAGPPTISCSHGAPSEYEFEAGQSYFGENNWIEYIPGTLPIIVAAPHGGELTPIEIPVFNDGLAKDGGSQQYARAVTTSLHNLTGRYPHLIINHLARNRLNLNRAQEDDNRDNELAMGAWNEFHQFINHLYSTGHCNTSI